MIACDFFTLGTARLRRIYVLFLIELETRRVDLSGCTSNPPPSAMWVAQQARNLALDRGERSQPLRCLIYDRDSKFSAAFDEVFRSEGATVIKTPVKAPNAPAHAERWVRTAQAQCRDWLLIAARRQLERALRVYLDHYNRHRSHRALGLSCPDPPANLVSLPPTRTEAVHRRDRFGGLLHEHARVARSGLWASRECCCQTATGAPSSARRMRPISVSGSSTSIMSVW